MQLLKSAVLCAAFSLYLISASGRAVAAPDNTLGMALLGAVVNADGTLHHGAGVVSSTRANKGIYEVTFDRDITACFATASAQGFAIYASIYVPTTNTVRVFLSTQSTLPVEYDDLFHLIVYCPR